jgi:hypothetical protein
VPPVALDEGVDHRQQLRHALDLVDDHRPLRRLGGHQLPQPLGTGLQLTVAIGQQQVEVEGVGEDFAQWPRALAVPPAAGELRLALDERAQMQWTHPISGVPVRFGPSSGARGMLARSASGGRPSIR